MDENSHFWSNYLELKICNIANCILWIRNIVNDIVSHIKSANKITFKIWIKCCDSTPEAYSPKLSMLRQACLFSEWFLLLEALKPFCTTLLLIAVFSFIKSNSTLTTAATIESIFGAAYFGVGRGIGGLIGGFAIDDLGVTVTFMYKQKPYFT